MSVGSDRGPPRAPPALSKCAPARYASRHMRKAWLVLLSMLAAGLAAGCDQQTRSAGECDCAPGASGASAASSTPTGSATGATSVGPSVDQTATLTFRRDGADVRTLPLKRLLATIRPQVTRVVDPYYGREKTFRTLPLESVLELGFAGRDGHLGDVEFVLRARDGYTVAMRGTRLLEGGAHIAIEDVDVPGWEPIGPQKANPGPFYLVWTKPHQQSLETHPRPWQLAAIEIVKFEDAFPRTVPAGLAEGDPGWKGFTVFKEQCVHCHAMNRQGGRVGPELNVPRSIVEYRPVDQIKAYIKNPLDFRYSAMPPHPTMTDETLDAIVAYFEAMKSRKQDADAAAAVPAKDAAPAKEAATPAKETATPGGSRTDASSKPAPPQPSSKGSP